MLPAKLILLVIRRTFVISYDQGAVYKNINLGRRRAAVSLYKHGACLARRKPA